MEYNLNEQDWAYLDRTFTFHPAKDDQPERYAALRAMYRSQAEFILRTCPPSRERSLALTNLEQSNLWASAAIARNE